MLYKDGDEKATLKFDGKSSTYLDWFSMSKLLSSPWTDIASEGTNYFSIQGHADIHRNFFINRNYGGCHVDAGWLTFSGTACDWATKHPFNTALYSTKSTYSNWNEGR